MSLSSSPKRISNRKENTFKTGLEDEELLNQVMDFYHRNLKENSEALAYLEKRGIASREAIETFKLGYSNRTLGYLSSAKERFNRRGNA